MRYIDRDGKEISAAVWLTLYTDAAYANNLAGACVVRGDGRIIQIELCWVGIILDVERERDRGYPARPYLVRAYLCGDPAKKVNRRELRHQFVSDELKGVNVLLSWEDEYRRGEGVAA